MDKKQVVESIQAYLNQDPPSPGAVRRLIFPNWYFSQEEYFAIFLYLKPYLEKYLFISSDSKEWIWKNQEDWYLLTFLFIKQGIYDAEILLEQAVLESLKKGDVLKAKSYWAARSELIDDNCLLPPLNFKDYPIMKSNILDTLKESLPPRSTIVRKMLEEGKSPNPQSIEEELKKADIVRNHAIFMLRMFARYGKDEEARNLLKQFNIPLRRRR